MKVEIMVNTWIYSICAWILFSFLISVTSASTLENIYTSGCSGERIRLNCPKGHKIAIKRLYFGVKSNPRCTGQGRKYSDDCCHPTYNDCLVSEDDSKYPYLNMMCSGLPGCDVEANNASSGDKCRAKGYSSMTDYMTVIHDCIPDVDILPVCSNMQKKSKQIYISNENYPYPIRAGERQCQCLIKTGNQVGIYIHALDIIFYRSEVGNKCYQDIELRDDDGNRKVITCGHTGLNAFRNVYNNDVRAVTLTLNTRAPKAKGFVWVQAKAKEDRDFVEVFCGDARKRYLGYPVNDAASRTLNKNDPTPPLEPGDSGPQSNATKDGATSTISDMVALIVGVSVAVAFVIIIGLIGIIILCVRRIRAKRRPIRQEPPPFPSPMLKSKETNHSSNTYCRYDYDEDKYCSIKRSPMRMTKLSDVNSSAGQKLKEAFSQGVSSSESMDNMPNGGGYVNYMEQLSPCEPLLDKQITESETSDEDEVIMPKSEFVTIGKAIQPQSIARELTNATLPPKKKIKNKTVTFSPVAMVTPFPFGSEESVPDDTINDDPKANFLEMYSKTLPTRSPEKVKRIVLYPGGQDDMCLASYQATDCENVTEDDLWKAFHIKLSENMPSYNPEKEEVVRYETPVKCKNVQNVEDPDYDENPYDNVPYINVGSLRRHNTPENTCKDLYREIVKRHHNNEQRMESIPETC
ncbi:uncharacterized protein LOC128239458 [Mya arenaria]|uniref:uncharacterized protein LOC128239458 n=1 Tax=Mya arenaria TaxID=6604 RepID=UPI0022E77ADD|nr:uncharacterized protein LOC128239458 [Mya arenaria]XP_052812057.1 uncharacterized protein LOC128239458 [Mya arenaria]XP_052812058.1 uncharacterized protein LOC128239458 [Mya arenaria]